MSTPHNAGKTVTVEQILPMPVMDVDFGAVTITENWGRLFIKHGEAQIVVERGSYGALVAAISGFIPPKPTNP